jgi:uncharacterized protein (DUF433 family)
MKLDEHDLNLVGRPHFAPTVPIRTTTVDALLAEVERLRTTLQGADDQIRHAARILRRALLLPDDSNMGVEGLALAAESRVVDMRAIRAALEAENAAPRARVEPPAGLTTDPHIYGGTPLIEGTRLPVFVLLVELAGDPLTSLAAVAIDYCAPVYKCQEALQAVASVLELPWYPAQAEVAEEVTELRETVAELRETVDRLQPDARLGRLVRGIPLCGSLYRGQDGWWYTKPLDIVHTGDTPEAVLDAGGIEVEP